MEAVKTYIEEYKEHQKYMIHFGENWDSVSQNRNSVYAANSKFALFSRIQEMINFIHHDRLYSKATPQ
jgi:hypothetical protein